MNKKYLKQFLGRVKSGEITEKKAMEELKFLPFRDLGFAKIDHHRYLRRGLPEIIFGKNKTKEQIIEIVKELAKYNDVMVTKTSENVFNEIKKIYKNAVYSPVAQIITIKRGNKKLKMGKVLILTAGTADILVAEEAAVTAEFFGNKVEKIYDVGVAGIHRLLSHLKEISKASVIIVIAGMEGALPSVVAGLTDKPIIAVPTSVGYGASFKGIAPLLTMLNSCSPGVVVVNIDNGFGAGYFASLINQ